MRTIVSAALMTLLLAGAALADPYSSLYVIPFANHIPRGTAGTETTDVAVHNFQPSPITLELVLVEYGLHNVANNIFPVDLVPGGAVTVTAGGSAVLRDVLSGFRGQSATIGALLLGSRDDRAFAATSRSYFVKPDGSTVGYAVPAIPVAAGGSSEETPLFFPGLVSNERFRTQIGFVVATAEGLPVFFELLLRGADGALIGSRPFFIGSGQVVQLEIPASLVADRAWDQASLEVRQLAGTGAVIPYVKVIDRSTEDAVFQLGDARPEQLLGSLGAATLRQIFRQTVEVR